MAGSGPQDWSPPETDDQERSAPRWGQRIPGAPVGVQGPAPREDSPFAELNRRRRRRTLSWLWAGTAVLVVLLVVTIVGRGLPFASREWVAGALPVAAPVVGIPDPASDAVDLAHRTLLTEEGREILYDAAPRMLGDDIKEACARPSDQPGDEIVAVGCYTGWSGTGAGRIFIYRPSDDRLAGAMVVATAHELLHAAYARLRPDERARVDELVAAETARLSPDNPTLEQIDWSVGGYEPNRATEQFAYLGSQVALDGGFTPELEQIYARYFTDRMALVELHRQSIAVVDDLAAQLQSAWDALAVTEQSAADARARLDADRAWHERAVPQYNDEVARFNAMDPTARAGWTETLTSPDGVERTLSWSDALAQRLADLDRIRTELETQGPVIAQQEADAAAQRSRVEALAADLDNLLDAAHPGRG
jgi:hypothetical protein